MAKFQFIALAIALAIALKPLSLCAAADSVSLVVNDDVEIEHISFDELRAVFGLRQLFWSEGVPAIVYVLDGDSHRLFCRDVLKVYPHQLKKGWDRMEYTGRASIPQVVESEYELLELVGKTPGSIGYISSSTPISVDGVHTIRVSE